MSVGYVLAVTPVAAAPPFNVRVHGNSFIAGNDAQLPLTLGSAPGQWPAQFAAACTASGINCTSGYVGHGGYAIGDVQGTRPSSSLTALVTTDVDTGWVSGKRNIWIVDELINDLYFGSTSAQVYANVQTYFAASAKTWDAKYIKMPTPRADPLTNLAGINRFGTSPPAVTIGATPAVGTFIQVSITTGGALGVAQYKWYLNSVLQASGITLTGSVTLGGTAFTFPAGTYSNDNVFYATAGFEAERQALIALINADPTFGGACTGVIPLDSRMFAAGACNNGAYFYCPGSGLDQNTHPLYTGHAIICAAVFDTLRAAYPTSFPYHPSQMPFMTGAFDAQIANSCLDGSSAVCTNGSAVATVLAVPGSWESGSWVEATSGARPTYLAAGINGKPAISEIGTSFLQTQFQVTLGIGTFVAVVDASAVGVIVEHPSGANTRLYAEGQSGGSAITTYALNAGATGSICTSPAGCIVGAGRAIVVYVNDGTRAGQRLRVNGVDKTLSTFSTFGADPGIVQSAALLYTGQGAGEPSATAKKGAVYVSPVAMSTHEIQNLEAYLTARW